MSIHTLFYSSDVQPEAKCRNQRLVAYKCCSCNRHCEYFYICVTSINSFGIIYVRM